MSQFAFQQLGCKAGVPAPPRERSATPAAPRTAMQLVFCRNRCRVTEGLSPCAATALRRHPTSTSGDSAGGISSGPSGVSRASQLYDLEREGAYTASSSLVPEPSPAAPADAGGGGDGFLDDGWGVVAVGSPSTSSSTTIAKPTAKRDKKQRKKQELQAAVLAAAPGGSGGGQRPVATPFFDKSSEAGLAGLTLLQARLVEEGRVAHGSEQKARVAAEAATRRERQAKSARRKRDWVDPDDLDVGEGEAEEMSLEPTNQQQYFEFNLEADGSTEVVEFDEGGRVRERRAPGAAAGRGPRSRAAADDDEDEDDPLAFLADLEDDDEDDDGGMVGAEDEAHAARGAAAGPSRRGAAGAAPAAVAALLRRGRGGLYDGDDGDEVDVGRRPMPGRDPLADEEIEWGLDEIRPAGRPSLMEELGVIRKSWAKKQKEQKQQQQRDAGKAPAAAAVVAPAAAGKDGSGAKAGAAAAPAAAPPPPSPFDEDDDGEVDEDERDVSVAWGGSGGASGIDMEQQEALLTRLFKPHKVKELMDHQRAAEAEMAALKRKTSGRQVLEAKVHSRMRIIAGSAAGRQLASSKGATTRPMMEKVRQAIFSMIQAQAGSAGGLPESARWLDFFAGTGSVGLEALSRGCRECHFIELDSWVCRKVLSKNISTCGFQRRSVIHTMKAEDFLRRSIDLPRFAGGPFDFISVCPPYLVVSYPELMDLLERSPLLHERSIVFVEYPKQLAHQVPPTLGSLVTVRDRKYGRTFIRVYGPAGGPADSGDGADEAQRPDDEAEDEGDELLL
ncbi:hypothetical protein PLESTF_001777400 [Pleodorina starrii]|nr:hypothetical protein PLESTF_001777400 [Pleodorina starrii]